MRFLVDASLPRSAVHSLKQMGHDAVDVRDIGMRSATDDVIVAQVRMNRQALVTRDFVLPTSATIRLPTTSGSSCFSFPMTRPPRGW
jgi:predicted nuclease of predicted toxin-antitoxin system